MNTQANRVLHLPLLSGGVAALLVSGIAIASVAVSAQGFGGVFASVGPLAAVSAPANPANPAPGAGAYRCAECGVIESMRKIEIPDELIQVHAPGRIAALNRGENDGTSPGRYAITIRLKDGSTRVITDAHPARWRPGERVSLIGGMN